MSEHDFRIALIDGDPAIRAGRRLLLDSQPDMKVVYEQSQAAGALLEVGDLLIDVLIIDHRLQGIDGAAQKSTLARTRGLDAKAGVHQDGVIPGAQEPHEVIH